jgi:hypothetical protein
VELSTNPEIDCDSVFNGLLRVLLEVADVSLVTGMEMVLSRYSASTNNQHVVRHLVVSDKNPLCTHM